MIDFFVHGTKGAMIKNGDIPLKEKITDKLLIGLGFKAFKEDVLLQRQAKKYWIQKITGKKVDTTLLNTDKITNKIKKEETTRQNKQIKKEQSRFLKRFIEKKNQKSEQIKTEQAKNLIFKVSAEKTDNRQLSQLPQSSQRHNQQQAVFEKVANRTANGLPANGLPANGLPANGLPTNGLPINGLKEKIGQAVQQTEAGSAPSNKQSAQLPEQQAARPSKQPGQSTEYLALLQRENAFKPHEAPAEKTLTVTELKQKEKKEAEINPTVEQSVQKQQKQNQKDFHNMIMMQQMQMQNNMQNTIQNKIQNDMQQQALQQQMEFIAAMRAGQQFLHQPLNPHPHKPLKFHLEELSKPSVTSQEAKENAKSFIDALNVNAEARNRNQAQIQSENNKLSTQINNNLQTPTDNEAQSINNSEVANASQQSGRNTLQTAVQQGDAQIADESSVNTEFLKYNQNQNG